MLTTTLTAPIRVRSKIKMSTQVKTETDVVVETSPKVIAAIKEQVSATVTLISKKRVTAETVKAEADRKGYDKKQASRMVAACWLEAFGMHKATEEEQTAFALKSRPDVSKVIALAYPEKPTELTKAYQHNDKLGAQAPKQNRIGENNLLKIARGEVTTKEIIEAKQTKKQNKSSNTLDQTLSKEERFANSIKAQLALHKVGQKDHLTGEQVTEIFSETLVAYLNPEPKKKK